MRKRAVLAGIVIGAVGTVVGLFTPPAVYWIPGALGLIALILGIIAWPAKPRVWFALILAALALCEALYGFGQVNHVHSDTTTTQH